jgi:lactoylglutathione lyase
MAMTLLHVALDVSDLEASIDFYRDLMDYEIVREMEKEESGRNVFLGEPDSAAADDAAVQLLSTQDSIDPGDYVHTALAIDDLDAALEWLDDDLIDGGPVEQPGVRVAFVNDPDGYGIELIEEQ